MGNCLLHKYSQDGECYIVLSPLGSKCVEKGWGINRSKGTALLLDGKIMRKFLFFLSFCAFVIPTNCFVIVLLKVATWKKEVST